MDTHGDVFFLEMNTRIQVEHTITEMATGIDLVREQILVAQGAPLSFTPGRGRAARARHRVPRERRGPDHVPALTRAAWCATASRPGPGVRVDSALEEGGEVVALYDPMVAKLVVWDRTRDAGPGADAAGARRDGGGGREDADPAPPADHGGAGVRARRDVRRPRRGRLAAAAGRVRRAGWRRRSTGSAAAATWPRSTAAGSRCTCTRRPTRCWSRRGSDARRGARPAAAAAGEGTVTSPMQGAVLSVEVADGDHVEAGQVLAIVEAMKMENEIAAPRAGVVEELAGGAGRRRLAGPGDLPDQRRLNGRVGRQRRTRYGSCVVVEDVLEALGAGPRPGRVAGERLLVRRQRRRPRRRGATRATLEQLADHVQEPLADRERHQEQHHHHDEADDPERPQAHDRIGEPAIPQPRHHAQRVRHQRAQDQQEQAQEPEAGALVQDEQVERRTAGSTVPTSQAPTRQRSTADVTPGRTA